jgi:hypothetical protein
LELYSATFNTQYVVLIFGRALREMYAGDIGRERRIRGKDGSGFAEGRVKSGLSL